jgi:hypothetical protein
LAGLRQESVTDPVKAEQQLRELCRSTDRQIDKSLAYSALLDVIEKRRAVARSSPDGAKAGVERTRDGLAVIGQAVTDLREMTAAVLFAYDALQFVGAPEQWTGSASGVSRAEAERTVKAIAEAAREATRQSTQKLPGLRLAAQEYLRWGFTEDAERVCTEMALSAKDVELPGYCKLTAALMWSTFPDPNWERCLVTMDEAIECDEVPAPTSLWARQEDLDRYRAEWTQKAREAPPKSRLAGYLTLWQRGLAEPMGTYWTDALRDGLKTEARALTEPARRPVKVGEIAAVEGQSDGSRATLTVVLEFPAGSPDPTGQWVFRLVGSRAGVPWLIDRIEPPAPRP